MPNATQKYTSALGSLLLATACGAPASDAGRTGETQVGSCHDASCLPHAQACNDLSWSQTPLVEAATADVPVGGRLIDGIYDVTIIEVGPSELGTSGDPSQFGAFEFKGPVVSAYVGQLSPGGTLAAYAATGSLSFLTPTSLHVDWSCSVPETTDEDYSYSTSGNLLMLFPTSGGPKAVHLVRRP
jgi:hypothetical protein